MSIILANYQLYPDEMLVSAPVRQRISVRVQSGNTNNWM